MKVLDTISITVPPPEALESERVATLLRRVPVIPGQNIRGHIAEIAEHPQVGELFLAMAEAAGFDTTDQDLTCNYTTESLVHGQQAGGDEQPGPKVWHDDSARLIALSFGTRYVYGQTTAERLVREELIRPHELQDKNRIVSLDEVLRGGIRMAAKDPKKLFRIGLDISETQPGVFYNFDDTIHQTRTNPFGPLVRKVATIAPVQPKPS